MKLSALESPTEVVTCAGCPGTFTRRVRKRGSQVRLYCPMCRKARDQESQRRAYERWKQAQPVADPKPSGPKRAERKCVKCGGKFQTSAGDAGPIMCCRCALASEPAPVYRWGGEHALARNI